MVQRGLFKRELSLRAHAELHKWAFHKSPPPLLLYSSALRLHLRHPATWKLEVWDRSWGDVLGSSALGFISTVAFFLRNREEMLPTSRTGVRFAYQARSSPAFRLYVNPDLGKHSEHPLSHLHLPLPHIFEGFRPELELGPSSVLIKRSGFGRHHRSG